MKTLKIFQTSRTGVQEKADVFFSGAYYSSKPQIPTNAIYGVHSPEMVEGIEKAGVYEGVLSSAAGTYQAA
jgi:hypothetical protein